MGHQFRDQNSLYKPFITKNFINLKTHLTLNSLEPVFGQIKEGRGFRRFSLRGLAPVGAEWSIVCTCHNLLKLFRNAPAVVAAPS